MAEKSIKKSKFEDHRVGAERDQTELAVSCAMCGEPGEWEDARKLWGPRWYRVYNREKNTKLEGDAD